VQNFKKDLFWNTIGNIVQLITTFLTTIIIVRALGIDEGGVFTYALSIAGVFGSVAAYGGSIYQISDINSEFTGQNYLFSRLVMCGGATVSSVIYIGLTTSFNHLGWIVLALVVLNCWNALEQSLFALFQKNHRLYNVGKIVSIKSVTTFALVAIFVYGFHNLFLGLISSIIIATCAFLFVEYPYALSFDKLQLLHLNFQKEIKSVTFYLKKNFWIFLTTVISSLAFFIPRFLIELYHPNLQGILGISFIPFTIVITAFGFLIVPIFVPLAEDYHSKNFKNLNQKLLYCMSLTTLACLILVPCVIYLSVPLYQEIYKQDMSQYVPELLLLIAIAFFYMIMAIFITIFQIIRKLKTATFLQFVEVLLISVSGIYFVRLWEIMGAFLSLFLGIGVASILSFFLYYLTLLKETQTLIN
jgi:O-antigen/teichoic acid export membrane protein